MYANIAIMLRSFGRTLNPLKNAPYLEHQPLTVCTRGPRKLQRLLNLAFSGGLCQEMVQGFGGFLHREQSFVQFVKQFWRCAFGFWSYSNSNIREY